MKHRFVMKKLLIKYSILLVLLTGVSTNIFSAFEADANFLFRAAAIGDVGAVREVLNRSQWLAHKRDGNGRTPLHFAAARGHKDVVRVILDNNCDTDARDKDGRTALHFASGEGHSVVVRLLLERDAEIDAQDEDGRAPHHYAAINGHLSVVKVLIQHGCNIDIQDKEDNAPVHYAVFKHLDVAQYLINHGAHVSESVDRNILHSCTGYNWRERKAAFQKEKRRALSDICFGAEISAGAYSRNDKADTIVIDGAVRGIFAAEGTRDAVQREEMECPICKTELRTSPTLDIMPVCRQSPLHVVCFDCSLRMAGRGFTRCPVCRGPLL